jgi:hypothetical protein
VSRAFLTASLLASILCVLAVVGTPAGAGASGEVVYVLDVSRSHGPGPGLLRDRLGAWRRQSAWAGRPARVVLAGAGAIVDGDVPAGFEDGSRVDLGLELARRVRGAADTVIVLSDGRFDHAAAARQVAALAAEGVTVRFEGPLAQPASDLRLEPRGAARVAGGRARVRARVAGTNLEPRGATVTVIGSEGPVRSELAVVPGIGAEWEALVPVGDAERSLTVRLAPADGPDAAPGNDALVVPLERDRRRAALVGDRARPEREVVARALRDASFDVDEAGALADLGAAALAGLDLLVLVDQPMPGVPKDLLGAIEAAVTEGGLGLWVVGGARAFGAGGYAATPLETLLPLSSAPAEPRRVAVVLDTSGSMEKDARLSRAVDAVVYLAEGLGPHDRLQALPFADEAMSPVPASFAAPEDFLKSALPVLRRIVPRGGTRLLPALDAALSRPPEPGWRDVLVLVTDARDDAVALADLRARRDRLRAAGADAVVVLLDPAGETRARAEAIATGPVVAVTEVGPRLLLDAVAPEAFAAGPAESVLPDGRPGPRVAWKNRVRATGGALVALRGADQAPLAATAFRGAGRAAASAAWPAQEDAALALAREWTAATARPAEWRKIAVRREGGWLVVTLPPEGVPAGPLRARGDGGVARELAERTPGVFELPADAAPGPHLTILDGDRILAAVAAPPAGDPEYAEEPWLPPAGPPAAPGRAARTRAPWAVLAALSWAAAVLVRRRAAA